MDRITNVKEVSSFIMNFEDKMWNEVVLQLTIIGIRYINNYCHNYFKWRMEDLLLISEQLKQIKSPSLMNYKTFMDNSYTKKYNNNAFSKNQSSLYKYNFNYGNLSIYKKEPKDKSKNISNKKHNKNYFKSKSLLSKSSINDVPINREICLKNNNNGDMNMNNNSMQVLSGRENQLENFFSLEKANEKELKKKRNEKILNYFENNNEQNTFLKNKKSNNRSKILSLNTKLINNNNDENERINNYPLYNKNKIDNQNIKNDENKKDSEMNLIENKENILNNYISNNNEFKSSISYKVPKTYYLEYTNNNDNKNKSNNYLIEEMQKQKENYNKNSNDFISELRKLSHSKEKISKNKVNRLSNTMKKNQSFRSNSPFLILDNKIYCLEKYNQNNYDISNNVNINENQENNLLKKLNDDNDNYEEIKNYNNNNMKDDNSKEINIKQKENLLSKTDNRNNVLIKKDNFNLTYVYNSNINNSMDENIQNNKMKYNKYLKYPSYKNKNKKIRSNSIDDLTNKVVSNKSYHFSPGKENENNINSNLNYEKPNTERTTCHYFYESKQQSNENTINRNKKDNNINKY